MSEHDLKTWPEFFRLVCSGEKTFEVRYNDRSFRVGDTLLLREWKSGEYTGQSTRRIVTYILTGPAFGIESGYVCMSLGVLSANEPNK
jgi:hypothetical protein